MAKSKGAGGVWNRSSAGQVTTGERAGGKVAKPEWRLWHAIVGDIMRCKLTGWPQRPRPFLVWQEVSCTLRIYLQETKVAVLPKS